MSFPSLSPPTVVFDLDGTLVDTAPDLVATLNHILTREGMAPVAYDSARNMVGGGARVIGHDQGGQASNDTHGAQPCGLPLRDHETWRHACPVRSRLPGWLIGLRSTQLIT